MESGSDVLSTFASRGKRTQGNVIADFSLNCFKFSSCVQAREDDPRALATNSKSFASSREATKLKIVNLCSSFGSRPVIFKKKALPETSDVSENRVGIRQLENISLTCNNLS